jgi:F0F1-type ATP synthase membrane subunit b/b'
MHKKLLTTIKWQLKERPLIALALATILVALLWIYGGAFVSGVRSALSGRAVSQNQNAAQAEQQQAEAAQTSANQEGVNRKVEDAIRQRTIEPEVQRAGRVAVERRERTRRAEAIYEKARQDSAGAGLSAGALRERNCSNLRDLYPGRVFDYCR